jgi:hypothetical protein
VILGTLESYISTVHLFGRQDEGWVSEKTCVGIEDGIPGIKVTIPLWSRTSGLLEEF